MDLEKYMAKTNPDKTLLEHTKDVLSQLDILNQYGYIKSERLYKLTQKACHYHDYGKANKAFQERIRNRKRFNETKEVVHNVLSMYFINPDEFEEIQDYYRVAEAVLNHHNYGDVGDIILEKKELIAENLLEFHDEIHDIKGRRLLRIMEMDNDEEALLIKGYLHRCDYSASSDSRVEYVNDFLLEKLDGMMKRWKATNLNKAEPVEWNLLQHFCKEHSEDNLIITAQTGMGKTEAGLLWLGNHKGFFVLPIRTAINAIYERIRSNIINQENVGERLALLHSDTLSYYASKDNVDQLSPLEYRLRSRQLSLPITVTTLDQIFDFVFKYSGFEMKLATLSYSKLIIDEIQMYSADLLAYLIYGISMITKYGGKVAILTATLAPFVKDLLVNRGFQNNVIEESFTNNDVRHSVKIYPEEINTSYIIEKWNENKAYGNSNKILVVCNTVKKAQKIYRELAALIDEKQLHILHNKLIKKERDLREKEILEFGKTYESNGKLSSGSGIWVSTSIVEASLDIDFDYLYTELSDLNGLLQRLGRCNRKGKKDSTSYNCYVFTEIEQNLLSNGEKGFIDRTIYELSKEALLQCDGPITEQDKLDMINQYLITERLGNSDYIRNFNYAWNTLEDLNINELNKCDVNLRNIVTYTVIPLKIYLEKQQEIDSMIEQYGNENLLIEEKIRILDCIKQYTLAVEPYVIKSKSNAAKVEKIINLGKYEQIYVLDCEYSVIGFELKKSDGFTIW